MLVSYLPAMLARDFVWDDLPMIGTPAVREPGGLRQIWFSPGEIHADGHYWPLVYTVARQVRFPVSYNPASGR